MWGVPAPLAILAEGAGRSEWSRGLAADRAVARALKSPGDDGRGREAAVREGAGQGLGPWASLREAWASAREAGLRGPWAVAVVDISVAGEFAWVHTGGLCGLLAAWLLGPRAASLGQWAALGDAASARVAWSLGPQLVTARNRGSSGVQTAVGNEGGARARALLELRDVGSSDTRVVAACAVAVGDEVEKGPHNNAEKPQMWFAEVGNRWDEHSPF